MEVLIRLLWLALIGAVALALFFFAWFVALPVIILFVLYNRIWGGRDLRRAFSGVMPGGVRAGNPSDTATGGVIIEGDFVEVPSQPLEKAPDSSDPREQR